MAGALDLERPSRVPQVKPGIDGRGRGPRVVERSAIIGNPYPFTASQLPRVRRKIKNADSVRARAPRMRCGAIGVHVEARAGRQGRTGSAPPPTDGPPPILQTSRRNASCQLVVSDRSGAILVRLPLWPDFLWLTRSFSRVSTGDVAITRRGDR